MVIYLYDLEKKKDVKVTLTPEYSIPGNDLQVIFFAKEQKCGFENGKHSSAYDEYFIKRVHHIVEAAATYEGHKYHLTIGFYVSESSLTPFLINQRGTNDYGKFETSSIHDEHFYSRFKLFNYMEYSDLIALGLENLSFKEFVTKLIQTGVDSNQYKLYNVFPNNNDSLELLTDKGFNVFLDEEELKASAINSAKLN